MTISRTAVEGLQRISTMFDELCNVIAEYDDGAHPGNFAERLREILANRRTADHGRVPADPARAGIPVLRGTLRCFCAAVYDEDGEALLDGDGSERLAVISLPLSTVDVWAGENVEHGGTYYRDTTVFVTAADGAASHCPNCEHLFVAVQDAGKRIADSIGVAQRDDEDTYQWLERSVRELQAKSRRTDRRPRIFTFASGSEIDVDRYLGLDATATSRTDHGDRPAITFQLGHGGFLRVVFESEQQRVAELTRLRAFRDGAA